MSTGNWTLIDSEELTGYYRGEADATIKIYTYSLDLDGGAGKAYLTVTHFPQGEVMVTGSGPGAGGGPPDLGTVIADAADMSNDFISDTYSVTSSRILNVFIDCANVTDNTGTFVLQHRGNNGTVQTQWQNIDISAVFNVADADISHNAWLQLPPCDLRISYTSAGVTPDGDCTIMVTGG